jgi:hypothetical protein
MGENEDPIVGAGGANKDETTKSASGPSALPQPVTELGDDASDVGRAVEDRDQTSRDD